MTRRPDLAATTARLARELIAAERPILARHDLSMWAYVVLSALAEESHRSQGALADAIGADRTRIIAVLDDLEQRALITRERDPGDRRVRLLSLTAPGRRLREATSRDIQRNERRLLDALSPDEQAAFLRALERLAAAAGEAFA